MWFYSFIVVLTVAIGKHQTSSYKEENGNAENVDSEEETIQQIMKYERSAAALVCKMKSEAQFSNHLLIRDVVGIVATLGKVDDPNLSRWVGFSLYSFCSTYIMLAHNSSVSSL